jgi:hypothetical protein
MKNSSALPDFTRPRSAPRIEFHLVKSHAASYEVRSCREAIRFRVLDRKRFTLLDADWFSTNWELAPPASDAIFAYCEGHASEYGGGKACLIIHARPEAAAELKRFLARILSDARSWLYLDPQCRGFAPLEILEAAA